MCWTRLVGAAVVVATVACGVAPREEPARLVLRNGRIVTVDPQRPEVQALAIRGDQVIATGSNDEIQRFIGETTPVIDLAGRLAVPGFIEGHGHFTGLGETKMQLDLVHARTWDEIVEQVADAVKTATPGQWILGRGWHQEKWETPPAPSVEGFPLHDALSTVSPNNPVLLTHASGHATFANAKAMALAGITDATKNPAGGEILRDARGHATGLFRETASGLLRRAYRDAEAKRSSADRLADARRAIALASDEALSKGITTFQDAGSSFETIDLLKQMAGEKLLGLRLWVMVREPNDALRARLKDYHIEGLGDHRLTVRAIKVTMDGALGSRGAWLLEPYADLPTSTGLNTVPPAVVADTAAIAIDHGFQLAVHAIGDRANRETLDLMERAFEANPTKRDLRWRIEHAQHLNAADIPRFGRLGVIAAMQGIHCTSDAPYVLARLGQARAEAGAYVWQKLMQSGAVVINGTDAPVEDVDPIASFYASVTRKLKDGTVFYADQRMSRAEALRSYTMGPAYAAFEDGIKGSLTPGKLADITVLSRDILAVPDDQIPGTEVLYTIVGGEVKYRAPSMAKD